MGLFSWLLPKQRITYISHFIRDENPRFLHIIGANRIMPENGDSFDVYTHLVFDIDRLEINVGDNEKGEDIELNSPFVEKSMLELSRRMKTNLVFKRKENDDDEEEESKNAFDKSEREYMESIRPKVLMKSAGESETQKIKAPPADSFLFIDFGDDALKFNIEVRRTGRVIQTHKMSGRPDYFFKRFWIPEKEWLVFTYRKGGWARGGMAIAVIDFKNGNLLKDEFLPVQ